MATIRIGYCDNDPLKLDKTWASSTVLGDCGFLEPFSVTEPVVDYNGTLGKFINANYMYIEELNRYYFITELEIITRRQIRIRGKVDLRASYKDTIRANKAIIRRAEKQNVYNLYINDGSLIAYQDPYILTEPFPAGFTGTSFILAVAGGS